MSKSRKKKTVKQCHDVNPSRKPVINSGGSFAKFKQAFSASKFIYK